MLSTGLHKYVKNSIHLMRYTIIKSSRSNSQLRGKPVLQRDTIGSIALETDIDFFEYHFRLSFTPKSAVLNTSQPDVEAEQMPSTTRTKITDQKDRLEETRSNSPTKQVKVVCSHSKNNCSSGCCINGTCSHHSRCEPAKAAPRKSGKRRKRSGFGGGDIVPVWIWGIIGAVIFLSVAVAMCLPFVKERCSY